MDWFEFELMVISSWKGGDGWRMPVNEQCLQGQNKGENDAAANSNMAAKSQIKEKQT